MKTQNQRLIGYLHKHWYITRRQAAIFLGIMNLWERVRELEALGYKFDRRKAKLDSKRPILQYWLKQVGEKQMRKAA